MSPQDFEPVPIVPNPEPEPVPEPTYPDPETIIPPGENIPMER